MLAVKGMQRMARSVERRRWIGLGREADRVDASVESVAVVQRELVLARLEHHVVRLSPEPLALPLRAEDSRESLSVDDEAERPRAGVGVPVVGPVARTHPDAVFPAFRDERGLSVRHGLSHAVREQERRAHLVHELGVVYPSTPVLEPLRLNHDRLCARRKRGGENGEQHRLLHSPVSFSGHCTKFSRQHGSRAASSAPPSAAESS